MGAPAGNTKPRVDAFNDFVRHYAQPMASFIAHIFDDIDIESAVAEVFSVSWRRFEEIPAGRELEWLKGVAHNVARNMRRSEFRWRRQRLAALDAARTAPSTIDSDAVLDTDIARQAFAQLSAEDRALLRLQLLEDPTSEQLAAILGTTSSAARTRLSRARQRFQDICEQLSAEREP